MFEREDFFCWLVKKRAKEKNKKNKVYFSSDS